MKTRLLLMLACSLFVMTARAKSYQSAWRWPTSIQLRLHSAQPNGT